MSKNKNVHEIIKTINGEEWTKLIDKAYNKIAPKVKIDGFRPGKAPKDKIIKKYGEHELYLDAVSLISQTTFLNVLKESKLEPVIQPSMDIKKIDKDGVELVFTITTRPEVKLGKYKDLEIIKETAKVTKKEVDEEIKKLREQYAEVIIKDGKIELGDTAIINYQGFNDGVAFEGGKGENYPLEIGSNTFIPGFEEGLIGMSTGEEKDINVTFPKEYHSEDLKGKPVVFKVKVVEIKTKELPELNKEFFMDLGMDEVTTKEDFVKRIEETILHHKEHEIEDKYIDTLLSTVVENSEMEVIEEFVTNEVNRMLGQFEENIKMQGINLEQYCQFANTSEEKLRETLVEPATKRVKTRMALEQIAFDEKITNTDEEITKEKEKLAKTYQMTEKEIEIAFGGEEMINYDLQMQKAINIIRGEKTKSCDC